MTSAIGKNRRSGGRAGFTLIEIILVLGLIAFATAIVVTNFVAMVDRGNETDPEEQLRAAVREARFLAATQRRATTMRYDAETGDLIVAAEGGTEETRFALGEGFEGRRDGVVFYLVPSAEGLSPFPDAKSTRLKTGAVRFAPDRSSSPFVAEIESGNATPQRLTFDPFSNLVKTDAE